MRWILGFAVIAAIMEGPDIIALSAVEYGLIKPVTNEKLAHSLQSVNLITDLIGIILGGAIIWGKRPKKARNGDPGIATPSVTS
jgi:hypothetical protein